MPDISDVHTLKALTEYSHDLSIRGQIRRGERPDLRVGPADRRITINPNLVGCGKRKVGNDIRTGRDRRNPFAVQSDKDHKDWKERVKQLFTKS